ncbi:1,3-beta-glucanosyltransferase gas5 [Schizosaccharomyces pombe]|uniref:1,3-beta-glucanosyltransferase gas5 n=1 Tax=Schizosaccharomyces pombe (strain 972 / ATCC 24843) TaxID=284812 RepID=GAS5_SCHPO|nr:putative 1,3-beta-glucanosyltransferase Gas5 [Schizosaccharomyces pombe]O13692.1 RecName: Full=1,3-beta-glucanosyltransferase gas5; Flags: Precursor [Schizosaccharomyces pombe 972h-]CAB11192.1 cell wall protein Gas5, 1,3-beta-glucanosyltransferase (predicted) [Schizosaccharomyces pombe]|eukprot:NP_594938.1 putative 1,3-beta-glucanosyltransferase Gas5 [Schizosaccharomyces pombe]
MNFLHFLTTSLLLLGGSRLALADSASSAIKIKGNAFFNSDTNERFYVRGVDYQPGGSSTLVDPLADTSICKRDLPYLQGLNINTIRVYQVDNSANHDECMSALQDAGIYVILDLATSSNSISRLDAASSYNAVFLQGIFATIDAFKNYTNVLGFFAGNEVANTAENSATTTWVKAALRDAKEYISKNSDRDIPVGYSAADVAEIRVQCADFFACGNSSVRADFYGMNMYEWCGADSSFTISGYDQRMEEFANYSIPLFLSEYGCNDVTKESDGTPDRPFDEVDAIFSSEMSSVFSGGLVYQYSEEGNNYGLVVIDGDNVTISKNYETLKEKYASAANYTGDGDYSSSPATLTCPADDSYFTSFPLPTMPSEAKGFIESGAGQPLGFNAPSNQEFSANATALVSPGPHSVSTTINTNIVQATISQSSTSGSSSGSSSASTTASSSSVSSGSSISSGSSSMSTSYTSASGSSAHSSGSSSGSSSATSSASTFNLSRFYVFAGILAISGLVFA